MSTAAAPVPVAGVRQHAPHTRTQILGLLLIAAASLMVFIGATVTGTPLVDASFLIVPAAAGAVGAGLAWRFGTWANIVAIVLGLLGGMMTFWLVFGLFEPASFVEFTAGVTFVIGVLLMLGGGVTSIVRRKDQRSEATRSERIIERSALGLVAAAVLVSLPMWLMARNTVDAATAAGLPQIGIENFEFAGPTTVAATDGEVTLLLENGDVAFHTFTIDALGIDVGLVPGSSEVVTFSAEPGTELAYYCVPHSSVDDGLDGEDMAGTLRVE